MRLLKMLWVKFLGGVGFRTRNIRLDFETVPNLSDPGSFFSFLKISRYVNFGHLSALAEV